MKKIILLILVLLLFSCQNKESEDPVVLYREVIQEIETFKANGLVSSDNLRLREEPVLDSNIITKLMTGDQIEIKARTRFQQILGETESYWYKVLTTNNDIGWIFGYYTETDLNIDELEIDSDVRMFPLSKTLEKVSYVKFGIQGQNINAYTIAQVLLYKIVDDLVTRTETRLQEYTKVEISYDSFFYGPILDETKYVRLENRGESHLFIKEEDLLYKPLIGHLDSFSSGDRDIFYEIRKNPTREILDALLYKKDIFYKFYDFTVHNGTNYISVSSPNDSEAVGWIPEEYARIDLDSTRKHFLFSHLFGFSFPGTVQETIDMFGTPSGVYKQQVKNKHTEDSLDTINYLTYDGLKIMIYHATAIDKYILLNVEVNNNNYPLNNQIHIGQQRDEVLFLLGEPQDQDSEQIIYLIDNDGYESVYIDFSDDLLTAIGYNSLID